MKLNLKCGDNTNVKNGKVYSFQHKAIGPVKWMSTKEYIVTNCLAQEIELRQEAENGPLLSPFGNHNVSVETQRIVVNHNTIVWRSPKTPRPDPLCTPKRRFMSIGKVSIISTKPKPDSVETKTGRILDSDKQLEVLFHPKKLTLCGTYTNAYRIVGIPETYVSFDEDIEKLLIRVTPRPRHRRDTQLMAHSERTDIFAWGTIKSLAIFSPTESDDLFENKDYVVTTYDIGNNLFLMPKLPIDSSKWKALTYGPNTQQLITN